MAQDAAEHRAVLDERNHFETIPAAGMALATTMATTPVLRALRLPAHS